MKYRSRATPFEAFHFTGQPQDQWPHWLLQFYDGGAGRLLPGDIQKHSGRVACADADGGFWRWFDKEHFDRLFEAAEVA